ncbi:hypothetical protein Cgig2_027211 [Carnegiea gigantea]|uniref:Uncharacterized protein n=1 Tax=Carnegiea gigantea TaxID=171969 RepID=A0A9Q1GVI4_9CARY|nr:hypothetical protein Cgig2_027211 [Carnegiea gigantea]
MASPKDHGPGRNKRKWKEEEEDELVKVLKYLVNGGTSFKADNGFKSWFLNTVVEKLKAKLPELNLKAQPHTRGGTDLERGKATGMARVFDFIKRSCDKIGHINHPNIQRDNGQPIVVYGRSIDIGLLNPWIQTQNSEGRGMALTRHAWASVAKWSQGKEDGVEPWKKMVVVAGTTCMPNEPKDSRDEGPVNDAWEVIGQITSPPSVVTGGGVGWSTGETGIVLLLVEAITVVQYSCLHEKKESSLEFGQGFGGSENFQDQFGSDTM